MIFVSLFFFKSLPMFSFCSGVCYAECDREKRTCDTLDRVSAVCSHHSGYYSMPIMQESLIPSRIFFFVSLLFMSQMASDSLWKSDISWVLASEQHGVLNTMIMFMHDFFPWPTHLGNSVKRELYLYPKCSLSGHPILHLSNLTLNVHCGWSIMSCQF